MIFFCSSCFWAKIWMRSWGYTKSPNFCVCSLCRHMTLLMIVPNRLEARDTHYNTSVARESLIPQLIDRICIVTNGTSQPHISAENLVSCCTSCGETVVVVNALLLNFIGVNYSPCMAKSLAVHQNISTIILFYCDFNPFLLLSLLLLLLLLFLLFLLFLLLLLLF